MLQDGQWPPPSAGFSSEGRAKLRVFLVNYIAENTQLSPSLTRKLQLGLAGCPHIAANYTQTIPESLIRLK